jgi:hypothetical protein
MKEVNFPSKMLSQAKTQLKLIVQLLLCTEDGFLLSIETNVVDLRR